METDPKHTLSRLVGPAGPEVGCDACFDELDRYVELELAGQNADAAVPGLRAHLERLPGVSRGVREPAGTRRRRAALGYDPASRGVAQPG